MARDWAADVKKFVPDADDEVIRGIVRYCGIALQKPDSSLVSYGDPVELGRVKANFLRKKLALTDADDVLDAAIAAVGERMKGVNFKNRVTVYYLLVDYLGLHQRFKKAAAGGAGTAAAAGSGAAASGVKAKPKAVRATAAKPVPVAPLASGDVAPLATSAVTPAPSAAPMAAVSAGTTSAPSGSAASAATGDTYDAAGPLVRHVDDRGGKGGQGWLLWVFAGVLLLVALWLLLTGKAPEMPAASVAPAAAIARVAEPATTPQGAGVVSETRDGTPLLKVYFDTGKADVAPAFATAAETVKAYLDANPDMALGVSGYNDPTGNAVANAALSKRRAEAVQSALVAAGIPEGAIALVRPDAATDARISKDEARRVEVYVMHAKGRMD